VCWLSDSEMEQHLDGISPLLLGPEPIKYVNQLKDNSGRLTGGFTIKLVVPQNEENIHLYLSLSTF